MGKIADELHKFIDVENTSGKFEGFPEDAADCRSKWAAALITGIKQHMAVSNALGIGAAGTLQGVDDAFANSETGFPMSVMDENAFWPGIDSAMEALVNNVEANKAQGALAMAGFDQQNIVKPTGTFDLETSSTSTDADPIVSDGTITPAVPPTPPPAGSPCKTPATGGSEAVADTGFDLANRLEQYILDYLATGQATFIMSSLGVTVPVPSWIIPPPDGSSTKEDVVKDMIAGLNDDDVPKESIDQESDEPFDNDQLKGIFDLCILLLEKSLPAEEDITDTTKTNAKNKANEYLDELVFYNVAILEEDPPDTKPFGYSFVGLATE